MVTDLDMDLLDKGKLFEAILSDKNGIIKQLYDLGFTLKIVHVNSHGRYGVIQVARIHIRQHECVKASYKSERKRSENTYTEG